MKSSPRFRFQIGLLLGVTVLTAWQIREHAARERLPFSALAPRPVATLPSVRTATLPGEDPLLQGAPWSVPPQEVLPQAPAPSSTPSAPVVPALADFTPELPPETLPHYVIHARPILLAVAQLPSAAVEMGGQTRLNLFGEKAVTVQWTKKKIHAPANFAWYGRLADDPLSAVTLTRVAEHTIIEIQSPNHGHFEFMAPDGQPGQLRQFDEEKITRSCGGGVVVAGFGSNGAIAEPSEPVTQAIVPRVDAKTIDVLMVYTSKAREKAGSRGAIVSKAQSAVNSENGAYDRSGIVHNMRLVQTLEVSHTSSGNLSTELGWVAGNSTVASQRSTAGADLVAFLSETDNNNTLGIAQQLTSTGGNSGQVFSANFWDTVSGVWQHEAGHNLGCQHNSAGVYSYSSGHHWYDSSSDVERGSIMSYIGGRIAYFSNPDISYSDEKTGTSTRNNAQSVNYLGDNVAGYRTAKTLIEPACAVSVSTSKPREGSDFTITISSKNGGPSTATDCKITVTLPSKLTLVSHDGGANFSTTTKVWAVPDNGNDYTKKLVLTVRPAIGSAGLSQTVSAKLSAIGSTFVDYDLYNNSASVTVTPVLPPSDGPILHYTLDETSGKIAADSAVDVGGAQDAFTYADGAMWSPSYGMIGGALRFGPTTQTNTTQSFRYDAPASLISAYPLTIAFWMRTTPGTWFQTCAMLGDLDEASAYIEAFVDGNSQGGIMVRNTTTVGVSAIAPTSVPINDDRWHHIAGVYTSATSRTYYVDGVAAATNTTNVPFVPSTKRFSIGALLRDPYTRAFVGALDDVALWNIALTPGRIALIHALGRYSKVDLEDPAIATLVAVDAAPTGYAKAGDYLWTKTTGLPGAIGSSGQRNGQPYVVLGSGGRGLIGQAKPSLTLAVPAPESVSLRWHSGFSDWILQESSDLSSDSWSDSPAEIDDDGLQRSIVYPIESTDQLFFRLRAP